MMKFREPEHRTHMFCFPIAGTIMIRGEQSYHKRSIILTQKGKFIIQNLPFVKTGTFLNIPYNTFIFF
jgi:hypothetical protein